MQYTANALTLFVSQCFFKSLSNSSTGYLVGRGKKYFKRTEDAMVLEQNLAATFGSPKVQLDFAKKVTPSSQLFEEVLVAYGSTKFGTTKKDLLWYQPVDIIPEPNLLIHKVAQLKQDIPAFSRLIANNTAAFKATFQDEVARLERTVNHPKYFLLLKDFQVMVSSSGE